MKKQRWEESEKRREEERRSEKRKRQKTEDAGAGKVEKSRFIVFFQWFVAPEGRKVGSLKRRVRSHLARWGMKNCTPLCTKHISKSKCVKHTRLKHFWKLRCWKSARRCGAKHMWKKKFQSTFGSWDVEKVHALVGRSTFWSENVQNTPCSEHFWKLRWWKSARPCGAKHMSSQKCKKLAVSEHFLRLGCGFAWQAQESLHLPKSEQNVMIL